MAPTLNYLSEYPELMSLAANPAFRALPFVDPDGLFQMHRNGPSSYAIIPEINSNVIIKVRKAAAYFCVMPYRQEHSLIAKLSRAKFRLCKTPIALAIGDNPQFLAMKRLGPDFTAPPDLYNYYQKNGGQIACALAEFAVFAYKKMGGLIHTDLHPNNSTFEPDGKIGIIDIAALSKTKPERMLVTPMLFNAKMTLRLAQIFSYETSYQFDLNLLRRRGELSIVNPKLLDHERTRCKQNVDAFINLAQQDSRTFKPEPPKPA